jgi:hypothetical protein
MRRVCVDWDGTLVDDNKWPEMGDWLPGAVGALRELALHYEEVVIFTCRTAPVELDEVTPRSSHAQINLIERMLHDARLPWSVYVWTKPYKPPAEVYIDNRAVKFAGYWGDTLEEIGVHERDDKDDRPWLAEAPNNWRLDQDATFYGYPLYQDPVVSPGPPEIRTFETGATRDTEAGKLDYEGFLSPWALSSFAEYMHRHRTQSDGTLRDSDNWQKGIPTDAYMKSAWRHFTDVWQHHRSGAKNEMALEEALCALLFNVQGYLHELVKPPHLLEP